MVLMRMIINMMIMTMVMVIVTTAVLHIFIISMIHHAGGERAEKPMQIQVVLVKSKTMEE